MKVIKFLSIIILLFVLLLAGLITTLNFVDINRYKNVLAQQITERTGREFAIDGNAELSISLEPRILLRDVRFQNAHWGDPAEMLKVDEVELQIALLPLLYKRVEVLKLAIDGLELLVESNKEHKINWDLSSGKADSETNPDGKSNGTVIEFALIEVIVENSHILYKERPGKQPTRLDLDKLTVDRLPNGLDRWDLSVKINTTPASIKGTTSSLHGLVAGRPFESQLDGDLGDIGFTVAGKLTLHEQLDGVAMTIALKAPDLKTAATLAGIELPQAGPIAVTAKLSDSDNGYRVDLNGNLANIKLALEGTTGKALDGKAMKVKYSVEAPDLKTAAILAGTELPNIGPIKAAGTAANAKDSYLLTLNGTVAELKIAADGRMAHSLDGKGIDMNLSLQAPDLARIGKLTDTELPPLGPVDIKAKLNDIKGGYKLSALTAKVEKSDLAGAFSVVYESKPMQLEAKLTSTLLDLIPFLEATPKNAKASTEQPAEKIADAAPAQAAGAASNARVFPDAPLPFEQLQTINADLDYQAKELLTGGEPLRDVKLTLKLDNGRLELKPVHAVIGKGSIAGDLVLDASKSPSQADTTLNLQVNDLLLGSFEKLQSTLSGGSTQIDVQLEGTGSSVRDIMAGLNGKSVVNVGEATLSDDTLNLIGGSVLMKLLSALTPKQTKSSTAGLECAVVSFDVDDGIARTNNGIVVQTQKMLIIGSGEINLKSEQINLHIRSHGRSLSVLDTGDLTRVVGLGGTLANPAPVVDVEGVAKTGATIGAAVLTLGGSYLAQKAYAETTRDKNPCQTALEAIAKTPGKAKKGTKTPETDKTESKQGEKAVKAEKPTLKQTKGKPERDDSRFFPAYN